MNTLNEQLIGTWVSEDEDTTSNFTIAIHQNKYNVSGIDLSDGEIYKIEHIEWNGASLSFTTLMPSTGYSVKYDITPHSENEAESALTVQEKWKKTSATSGKMTSSKAEKEASSTIDERFLGVWVTEDEDSDVIVTIAAKGNQYQVSAYDKYDKEQFEIKNTLWDGTVLSFDVRVPSTGFRAKNAFSLSSPNQASLELTFYENWIKI